MVQEPSEVEKIRFLRLNQVFDRALKQSLVKFQDWDKFSSSFPTYSTTKDGVTHLVNCQKQVTEFWNEFSRREFEDVLGERDVKAKLDELDELVAEANLRLDEKLSRKSHNQNDDDTLMDVPISELTPSELLECNLYPERQTAIGKLDDRLNKIKDMNQALIDEINGIGEEITDDFKEINDKYTKFLGEAILNAPDKELQEGLHDMLVQQSEYAD